MTAAATQSLAPDPRRGGHGGGIARAGRADRLGHRLHPRDDGGHPGLRRRARLYAGNRGLRRRNAQRTASAADDLEGADRAGRLAGARLHQGRDAPVGIEEGRLAGCWTVGLSASGNGVGLDQESLAALPPEERAKRLAQCRSAR